MSHRLTGLVMRVMQCITIVALAMAMNNIAAPPVKAQGPPGGSMAQYFGSYNYKDMWLDQNSFTAYGSGSTQAYSNPYNHRSKTILTLTSPSGRVTTFETAYTTGAASALVSLPFDFGDVEAGNNFQVCSDHFNFCPVTNVNFASVIGSCTTLALFGGWSEAWYTTTVEPLPNGGNCDYNLACDPGTDVYCTFQGGIPITTFCTKKWIKEIIPIDSTGFCDYSHKKREWWDTKFGTCGRHGI